MTSNPCDVEVPATEIEIGDAIRVSDPGVADVIRRLAFERDRLRSWVQRTADDESLPRGYAGYSARRIQREARKLLGLPLKEAGER